MVMIKPLGATAASALDIAKRHAPYLRRLAERRPDLVDRLCAEGPRAALDGVMAELPGGEQADGEAAMAALRRLKQAAHLAIASGDLSGEFDLAAVTSAMTAFADGALQAALAGAAAERGLSTAGLFMIALGKMGAGELNYSSDIDIAAFYDPDRFDGRERSPGDAASRLVREVVRRLEEATAEGYVFRTDLRLRPDPRSTPLAVSTRMAELYYESLGQNWERMVWIKARAVAGDLAAAETFINVLQPFVWRRHLDYWAIADIHAIKRQINAHAEAALEDPAPDLKLGPGGIREIEFFAQTQQLILGGRDPRLRRRDTLGCLAALTCAGAIERAVSLELAENYCALRAIEHRIQMRNDEQTHSLPANESGRSAVAALCGAASLAAFETELRGLRGAVNRVYSDLFAEEERRVAAAETGNLVFTGVDDDPGTVETLRAFGFTDPAARVETIRQWCAGRAPATRTERGRVLLTALIPDLLAAMAETGEPDLAFQRFAGFFEHLRTGVQTLAMLLAEPALLTDLVATLALAPPLARTLARQPDILEVLIDTAPAPSFHLLPSAGFDEAMDAARRFHRERSFLIGHRLLHARIGAEAAAAEWSDLAETAVSAMAASAEQVVADRTGPAPGPWCVAALGTLGAREMTAGSDLDLIIIYDVDSADADPRWFARFTQRLITALSAPTAEGALYEVDMRLRPSGNAGPPAVKLSSFRRYHAEDAWTWERMALTRLRPIAGDPALMAAVEAARRSALEATRDPAAIRADVLDMRRRLAADRPGFGVWDLKLDPGGLVDVDFIVQAAMLAAASTAPGVLKPSTPQAIVALTAAGAFTGEEAEVLADAQRYLSALNQIMRLAAGEAVAVDALSKGLKDRIARAAGCADFAETEARLFEIKAAVTRLREVRIGAI